MMNRAVDDAQSASRFRAESLAHTRSFEAHFIDLLRLLTLLGKTSRMKTICFGSADYLANAILWM